MRVANFIEVTKDDDTKARVNADAVEVVSETRDGLTVCTTRVTLKVKNETMESFWCKLRAARGDLESRVHGDECVPNEKRPIIRPKPGPKPKAVA